MARPPPCNLALPLSCSVVSVLQRALAKSRFAGAKQGPSCTASWVTQVKLRIVLDRRLIELCFWSGMVARYNDGKDLNGLWRANVFPNSRPDHGARERFQVAALENAA